jgi:hypothetical protein
MREINSVSDNRVEIYSSVNIYSTENAWSMGEKCTENARPLNGLNWTAKINSGTGLIAVIEGLFLIAKIQN